MPAAIKMDFGENVFFLLALLCFVNMAEVVSQNPGDFDFGLELGDVFGGAEGLFEFSGGNDQGSTSPSGVEADMAFPLNCFQCTTSSSETDHSNCLAPEVGTVTVTQCETKAGHTNHCGHLTATVSNTIPGNPEEKSQIDWSYRGCVPVPNHKEYGSKCYVNADLDSKVNELLGETIKQLLDIGADSTVESEGCFCVKDLCNGNGAPSAFKLSALIALPLALAASYLFA